MHRLEVDLNKVRVSLNRGVRSWAFVLYDSAESAYYLKDETPEDVTSEDEDFRRVVVLRPGETLEAEWMGSEWVYADPDAGQVDAVSRLATCPDEKFDKVRIGKTARRGSDDEHVEVYSGWVISGQVPLFQEVSQENIRITPVKGRIRSRFDFTKIFLEQELDDSEPEFDDTKAPSGPSN